MSPWPLLVGAAHRGAVVAGVATTRSGGAVVRAAAPSARPRAPARFCSAVALANPSAALLLSATV